METYKELIILIAEDDEGHAELIREGLDDSGICNDSIRFKNGEELWHFVSRLNPKEGEEKAKRYILLLDINMPKMDGLEVLKRMKTSLLLKEIPIIMLTTTDDPREVEACYALGCNFYITKPVDFIKFTQTLKQLGLFIQIVTI